MVDSNQVGKREWAAHVVPLGQDPQQNQKGLCHECQTWSAFSIWVPTSSFSVTGNTEEPCTEAGRLAWGFTDNGLGHCYYVIMSRATHYYHSNENTVCFVWILALFKTRSLSQAWKIAVAMGPAPGFPVHGVSAQTLCRAWILSVF